MPSYKITGVKVEVKPGVTVTAEISSPAELRELLADLEQEGFAKATGAERKVHPASSPTLEASVGDTPEGRIETRASLSAGKLATARLLAFKDGNPQLLRPGAFGSVSDATLALLYAVEIGLEKSSIAYDDFKDLHDAQNIKSGTPLPMLLTNLRNAGYIDKKVYATDRTIRLTAKGATKAEEVITALIGSRK